MNQTAPQQQPRRASRAFLLPLAATWLGSTLAAGAFTVAIDYSHDTNDYFGAGNPDGAAAGAQAKAALEAAATFYNGIINDHFSAITPSGVNSWTIKFPHPSTGLETTISDPHIPADTYVIYAGGRSLSGTTLGKGGYGGYNASGYSSWFETLRQRGQGSTAEENFVKWGGAITFDNDTPGQWHYDHTTTTGLAGKSDFYSVALHELGHALGLGTSDAWNNDTSGSSFTGPNATAAYGGSNPPVAPGHWAEGTTSTVYGDPTTTQEAMMDPSITVGTRKLATELDIAAMKDIGWEIVPEPSAITLLSLSGLVLTLRRKR